MFTIILRQGEDESPEAYDHKEDVMTIRKRNPLDG